MQHNNIIMIMWSLKSQLILHETHVFTTFSSPSDATSLSYFSYVMISPLNIGVVPNFLFEIVHFCDLFLFDMCKQKLFHYFIHQQVKWLSVVAISTHFSQIDRCFSNVFKMNFRRMIFSQKQPIYLYTYY